MTVVTLGVHIVDVLARPVESIPEGQDTHLLEQIRITAAGAAAGTAVGLAGLGVPVASMGAVGADELGDFLIMVMARHGVDVTGIVRKESEQTAASILPIRPDGGRPSFHVPGANLTLATTDLDRDRVTGARVVHLGGMDVTWGLHDPGFLALLAEAREAGTIVTMDLLSNIPDLMQGARIFLPYVDYLLPNEEQALMMSGTTDVEQAALALLAEGPEPCWSPWAPRAAWSPPRPVSPASPPSTSPWWTPPVAETPTARASSPVWSTAARSSTRPDSAPRWPPGWPAASVPTPVWPERGSCERARDRRAATPCAGPARATREPVPTVNPSQP